MGWKKCKPLAAFEEDELAMAALDEDSVEALCRRAAVQWRCWPVAVLPVTGCAPSLRSDYGCVGGTTVAQVNLVI